MKKTALLGLSRWRLSRSQRRGRGCTHRRRETPARRTEAARVHASHHPSGRRPAVRLCLRGTRHRGHERRDPGDERQLHHPGRGGEHERGLAQRRPAADVERRHVTTGNRRLTDRRARELGEAGVLQSDPVPVHERDRPQGHLVRRRQAGAYSAPAGAWRLVVTTPGGTVSARQLEPTTGTGSAATVTPKPLVQAHRVALK